MSYGIPSVSAVADAVAAVGYLVLALRSVAHGRADQASPLGPRVFCAAALASAAWSVAGLASAVFDWTAPRLTMLADVVRYGFWFGFLLTLLRPYRRSPRRVRHLWYVPALTVLLIAGALLISIAHDGPGSKPTRFSSFAALALSVCGLVLTEQLLRNVSEELRWGIKPLYLGLASVFAFDFYLYSNAVLFGELDRDAVDIRSAVHALALPFLFVATQRNSNWLARLQVSRTAAFHSVALLLAGGYLLFVSAMGYYVRYFGGSWGKALQLGLSVVALVTLAVVLLSGSMRAKLRVWLGKHFFSYRYDYRREWLRFTSTLASSPTPQDTGRLVIRGLADMLESPAGGLWAVTGGDGGWVQTARWNAPALSDREPANSPFAAFLLQRAWIVDLDEYRQSAARYAGLAVPHWLLAQPQFWLVVPLIVSDALIGFVVLARPRTPIDVNWEVTDLLKTASRQAASFLAQMTATEALLEVRKFDAFNRMSAFVVHDLKNIVTQLSLMMKNAERLRDNAEFQDDMMLTIESSLEKMRRMMLQLRQGEAPSGGVNGVLLPPILRRLEATARSSGRALEVHIGDRVATRGHEERIERVLGHVVQNALDATPTSGRVWIRLERSGGQVQVEIGDTGHGMSPEFVQQRLFKPFQTTKPTGMGIGAYESFQYIHELGGSIAVDSQPDRGTVVTILLPLFDSRETSDLELANET